MARVIWRIFPDNITLSDPDNWHQTAQDRHRATRYYVAIEEEKTFNARVTPPLITVPVPAGAKPVFSEKKIVVVTYAESISEMVQHTVTSKIVTESSLKSSVSLKDSLSAELQTKIGTEISESLSTQLSGTKTYQVQSTHEITTSVAFERPEATATNTKVTYYLYLPVWPVKWNIYLYKVESLELSYRRFSFHKGVSKFFKKIREIGDLDVYQPKIPIAQLSFYEPQELLAVQSGEYTPDVLYPDEVHVGRLTVESSKLSVGESTMSLEDCAKVAFPETEEEVGLRQRAKKANKERKKSPLASEIETVERSLTAPGRRGAHDQKKSIGLKKQKRKLKSSLSSATSRAEPTGKAKKLRKRAPSGKTIIKGKNHRTSKGLQLVGTKVKRNRGANR
jgi:hypothetical protein